MNLFTLNNLFLLLTGLCAIYLLWRFYGRWKKEKGLYDVYYMMGFLVLLVSGLLLIFLGLGILGSPMVLTVASLIPLGISMGLMEQYCPKYKKIYKWFALVGIVAIALSAFVGLAPLRKIAVPVFHGVAGLVIFLLPLLTKKAGKGFFWVGIGGLLIAFVYDLSIDMGTTIGMKGFASAVLGGFGNIIGAMFGGLTIGVIENLGAYAISYYFKDLVSFVILIIILLVKPTGLFIKKGSIRQI